MSSTSLGNDYNFLAVPGQEYCASILQILPVDLTGFSGRYQQGKTWLQWETSSELNSQSFTIERQAMASAWEDIGEVAAQGTSSTPKSYNFVDPNPGQLRNVYRLRQIDTDGTFHYSKTIEVFADFGNYWDFTLTPNPAQNKVTVYTGQPLQTDADIQLLDLTGRVLHSQAMNQSDRSTTIDVANTPPGVYMIKLFQAGEARYQRLIIQ